MDTPRRQALPFRLIAFLLISAAAAWLARTGDARALARIDSLAPADYIAYQRHQHGNPYVTYLGGFLLIGALYLAAIALTAKVLRLLVRPPTSPDWGPTQKP